MVVLTNTLLFILSLFFYRSLLQYNNTYAKQMGLFMLALGTSSVFGAIGHTVQHQLGLTFFNIILYLMSSMSLLSVLFCFRGTFMLNSYDHKIPSRILYFSMGWLLSMLLITLFLNVFVLVKIHAGLVLAYFFIMHLITYVKSGEKGSGIAALGTAISFIAFPVHTLKLSFHEWFNYKDISHVIMIISLTVMYIGIKKNADVREYRCIQKLV